MILNAKNMQLNVTESMITKIGKDSSISVQGELTQDIGKKAICQSCIPILGMYQKLVTVLASPRCFSS